MRNEQSLTQDLVFSFESIMGCGLGKLKAEIFTMLWDEGFAHTFSHWDDGKSSNTVFGDFSN